MPSWRKVITSGSDANLKSLVVSQSVNALSFTGSLQGNALSAEVVVINSDTAPTSSLSGSLWYNTENLTLYVRYTDPSGSSYWVPSYNDGIPLTSSYSITSSYVKVAQTASYVETARTASTVATVATNQNALHKVVFVDAASNGSILNVDANGDFSYNPNQNIVYVTSSYAGTALTASFVATAQTASRVTGSNVIGIVSQAYTASFVSNLNQNVVISTGSITMPNRPAFRVVGSGGGKAAVQRLSGSYLIVDYQQGSGWDNSTGTFTAPISGLYMVTLVCRTDSNTGPAAQLIVYKNNTTGTTGYAQIMIEYAANTTMNHTGGSTISYLAAGDTLRMVVAVGTISFDQNDNFSVAYIG